MKNQILKTQLAILTIVLTVLFVSQIHLAFASPAAPTYSNVGTTTTIGNASCTFHTKWTGDTGKNISGYIFGTNNTGAWSNETWQNLGSDANVEWSNVTKTLNASIGKVIRWQIWANDTDNTWNTTGLQSLTVKGYALNLRAIDGSSNPLTAYCNVSVTYSGSATNKSVSSSGWANWTNTFVHNQTVTAIKVFYQGVWVNGTFSLTMTANRTINVSCKVYSLTTYATDANGNIVANASLSLLRDSTALNGQYGLNASPKTNATGYFVWSQLANQTYKVQVTFQNILVGGNSTTLTASKNLTLACEIYRLTVKVQKSGVGVSGCPLELWRGGTNINGLYSLDPSPQTNSTGYYVWTQLANQTTSYTIKSPWIGFTEQTTTLTTNKLLTFTIPIPAPPPTEKPSPPTEVPTPTPTLTLPTETIVLVALIITISVFVAWTKKH